MKKTGKIATLLIALIVALCAAISCGGNKTKKYSVTVNACEGVTVECAKEIGENSDLSFKVKLNDGYEGQLTVSATVGGTQTAVNKTDDGYTVEKVNGDVIITVAGARKSATAFSVTVNKCDGAIVSGYTETVEKDGLLTFSVATAEGYEGTPVISVTVGGKEVEAPLTGNFYAVNNVTGDVVITVTGLTKKTLAVTKTAGDGVTVNGEDTVLYGEDYTFTVTLAEGYVGATVTATVGGNSAECTENNGVYTVKAVKGSLVIDAQANGKRTYKVDFRTESEHIVLPTSVEAEYGDSYEFTVVPETGYKFSGDVVVKVNEVEISKNDEGKYVISAIDEYKDVEIIAEVEEITFNVSYVADVENGLGEQSVKTYAYSAATVKFKITLAADYSKSQITVSYAYGETAAKTLTPDADGYYSFENVKADVTVGVTGLTLDVYTVNFLLGTEVKYSVQVTVHEKLTAEQLSEAAVKVVENSEYKFVEWNEETNAEITSDCEFTAKTLWGEKTEETLIRKEKVKVTGSEEDGVAPDNFEKVYKYVWNEGEMPNANSFSALNIARYEKVGLKLKSNHWVLLDGWDFANIFSDWAEIQIVKTDVATYTLTVKYGEKNYTDTLKGETLANMLVNFSAGMVSDVSELYTLWFTEIRVVEDKDYTPSAAIGNLIGSPLREDKNLGVASDVVAPMGYETVYKAKDPDMAAIDISTYSEVRMGIIMNGYYLFKPDWTKLADKRGVWLEIKLTKDGGTWNVTVINLYQGGDASYTATSDSNVLNEIVNWGFSLASDESAQMLYVTELRGTPDPAYGTIDKSIFNGEVKSETETVPAGYSSVYAYTYENDSYDADAMIKMPLADISLEGYDKVTFRIMSDQEIFFDGWGVYVNRGTWTEIVMVKVEGGWKISSSATLQGGDSATWLESVHAGSSVAEVFAKWELREKYAGEGQGHFYATNLITHKVAE